MDSQNDVNEDLSNLLFSNIETTVSATVKSAGSSTATQPNLPSQSDTLYHHTCTEHGIFDGAELTKFIAPGLSADIVEKVSFVKSHPFQPSSTAASLTFDAYKVYNRTMPTAVSPDYTVPRRWISYCCITKKLYCPVCMTFAKNRESPFICGLTVSTKHIYRQVERHEESVQHTTAVGAYKQADDQQAIAHLLNNEQQDLGKNNNELKRKIVR